MPHDDKPEKPLVATIGNGIMGHGIAEVFATAGHDVVPGAAVDHIVAALAGQRVVSGAPIHSVRLRASQEEVVGRAANEEP